MKVVGIGKQVSCGIIDVQQARRAVADVEDEMPGSVGSIGDEGGAGGIALVGRDRRYVGAERSQPVNVQLTEIVLADGPDESRWLAKRCRLANEDRGRAGRERPNQWPGFEKALADPIRHDLDEDLAGGNQLLHHVLPACAACGVTLKAE